MSPCYEIMNEWFRKHKIGEQLINYYQNYPYDWQLAQNRRVVEEHRKRHEQKARKSKH